MSYQAFVSVLLLSGVALAQSVQPVIVEYKGNASGKFAVTNNTLAPMVVMLEPKSFSITPEGRGVFRPLDANIHVELSTMSVKLQPKLPPCTVNRPPSAWYRLDVPALISNTWALNTKPVQRLRPNAIRARRVWARWAAGWWVEHSS